MSWRLLLSLALCAASAPAFAQSETIPRQIAVLQGLDKITARISTFEAPIGEAVTFGSLDIVARTCRETPPEEPPESAAFLEVVDKRPDGPEVQVFSGWMFASSPAVSALEHPVYDVWVKACRDESAEAPSEQEEDAAEGEAAGGESATQ
ncbi:MAG: DUF2155 domain-containing protein [Rhodovibrionaceae bacterium]